MTYAIERSCVNKSEVVSADEREGGVRATLNLGHTFGHAMESSQGYGGPPLLVSACTFLTAVLCYSGIALSWLHSHEVALGHGSLPVSALKAQQFGAGVWLHGEAVAAGMVMAADMSLRLGWIKEDILHRTISLLKLAELPTKPPQVFTFAEPFVLICWHGQRHSGRCLSCPSLHVCECGLICA